MFRPPKIEARNGPADKREDQQDQVDLLVDPREEEQDRDDEVDETLAGQDLALGRPKRADRARKPPQPRAAALATEVCRRRS